MTYVVAVLVMMAHDVIAREDDAMCTSSIVLGNHRFVD
jgi:hypothetical protein